MHNQLIFHSQHQGFNGTELVRNFAIKKKLSPRETQILEMFSKGDSEKEISESLKVTIKTVYSHRRNLMLKLGFRNRLVFYKSLLEKT